MNRIVRRTLFALLFVAASIAAAQVGATGASHYVAVDLSEQFNNDGISWDSDPLDGDLDFNRVSLPAEQVPVSGKVVALRDAYFVFPPTEDGRNNNVLCYNQLINLPRRRCAALHVLVTSVSGTRKATFTVTYADGSSSILSQRIPDMTGAPGFGKYVAVETDHRHTSEGDVTPGVRLYVFSFNLDPSKELVSLTLPEMPAVRIFAITLQPAEQ
ncbi:MAG: hypothetical protein AB1700_02205 [Bacillota bacterium]